MCTFSYQGYHTWRERGLGWDGLASGSRRMESRRRSSPRSAWRGWWRTAPCGCLGHRIADGYPFVWGNRGTKRVPEYARLAMGFAHVRAGTRVLKEIILLRGHPAAMLLKVRSVFVRVWKGRLGGVAELHKNPASQSKRGRVCGPSGKAKQDKRICTFPSQSKLEKQYLRKGHDHG